MQLRPLLLGQLPLLHIPLDLPGDLGQDREPSPQLCRLLGELAGAFEAAAVGAQGEVHGLAELNILVVDVGAPLLLGQVLSLPCVAVALSLTQLLLVLAEPLLLFLQGSLVFQSLLLQHGLLLL